VSEILGHASITITKDVYGHLLEGDRRAVAASMSQALFGHGSAALAPNGTERPLRRAGRGLVTWARSKERVTARSEGLEPPAF